MKIRMHRGTYADSLATAREVDPTFAAIDDYLKEHGVEGSVTIHFDGLDPRDGMRERHVLLLDGCAVAYTDQLPPEAWPSRAKAQELDK